MFRRGHLPDLPLDSLLGHPDHPAPAKPFTDSTCTWCPSDVTSPEVPSSERDLPWLRVVHCLLHCPAHGPGRDPVSHFCFEVLLLTGLLITTTLMSVLPMQGSTPPVRRRPLISTPPFSACLPIPFRGPASGRLCCTDLLLIGLCLKRRVICIEEIVSFL
jgi:hypothetical protein